MRAITAVQRLAMYLLVIPVLAVCSDTLLRAFNAQEDNPIVATVRTAADTFIFDTFRTVFPDQTYVQTALVTLAGYGIITLIVVAVFRGIRSVVAAVPRRPGRHEGPPGPGSPRPTAED
jgi:ABC-type proline/glycine betaine transport system permease subunit